MVDFQLKLFAESLNSADNDKRSIENSLIDSGATLEEISSYENIIDDLFKINDYEKKLGLELTQVKYEKSLEKLKFEDQMLTSRLEKEYNEEQKHIIDAYFRYSRYRTNNYLGVATKKYEAENPLFLKLYSSLEKSYDLFNRFQTYSIEDRNTILKYYYEIKNNQTDIKTK